MKTLVKSNGNGTSFPTIPSFFDDIFTRDLFNLSNLNDAKGATLPAVNVQETGDSFELEVAAPGMRKEDFKVELDNDTLIISAELKQENISESEAESGRYTRQEFSYQSFTRSFRLPEAMVEGDKIGAHYQDGILHIKIPKSETARRKPARQIKVE